jgi:hypothetical protein
MPPKPAKPIATRSNAPLTLKTETRKGRKCAGKGCILLLALFVLYSLGMTPLKRHRVGGPEIVQLSGLVILIGMICKYFGAGMLFAMTPSTITVFVIGICLLLWPMFLRERG